MQSLSTDRANFFIQDIPYGSVDKGINFVTGNVLVQQYLGPNRIVNEVNQFVFLDICNFLKNLEIKLTTYHRCYSQDMTDFHLKSVKPLFHDCPNSARNLYLTQILDFPTILRG